MQRANVMLRYIERCTNLRRERNGRMCAMLDSYRYLDITSALMYGSRAKLPMTVRAQTFDRSGLGLCPCFNETSKARGFWTKHNFHEIRKRQEMCSLLLNLRYSL